MIRSTLVALAFAGFGGMTAVATFAQQRQLGHESAVGPSGQARGPAGMGAGAAAPVPMQPGGPAVAAPNAPARPGFAPGQAPRGPAFGQVPMAPPPQRPMQSIQPMPQPQVRPSYGAPGVPNVGQQHAPNTAARVLPGGPINHAPRAYGAVPAPFKGNMRHFVDQDARVWNGGHWHHDHHRERYGWWWVVGGLWYFYPQPVYPYPDPFVPGDVVFVDGTAQYWYYCASAGQYYPYVTYCPEGWQPVIPDDQYDAGE